MKSTFITIALVALLFAFYLLPATALRAGMMGAWWGCVLMWASIANVKLFRRRRRTR